MRGKVQLLPVHHDKVGITPACAGKRELRSASGSACRDHPRVCGEKAWSTFSSLKNSGSPPRMRGKDCARFADWRVVGITPACAGKSPQPFRVFFLHQDHPRTCGEKSFALCSIHQHRGSPPHMRGKGSQAGISRATDRITPAHAGKRAVLLLLSISAGDHPRTCGEKFPSKLLSVVILGSLPHVRGKEVEHRAGVAVLRITPACAGRSWQSKTR